MTGETSRRNRKPDDAMKAAIAFVERINACDAEGLCELTTEDHRFVDSTGGGACWPRTDARGVASVLCDVSRLPNRDLNNFLVRRAGGVIWNDLRDLRGKRRAGGDACGVAGRCARKADC